MTVTPLDYTRWRASELGVITEALEREAVLDLAGPLAGLDLLDVGCGDGTYAITAVKAGARVSAVDASAEAIDAAGRRASGAGLVLDLRVGDASRLPYPDATFDLVLAVTVLCFIPDTAGAVREMARVLRPAGRLILGELGRWSLWAAWRRLRARLGSATWQGAAFRSAGDLRLLLAGAGLEPGAIRAAVFYPPAGWAAKRLAPVDRWLGKITTVGAAFIAIEGIRRS